jgi:hypothetical protein
MVVRGRKGRKAIAEPAPHCKHDLGNFSKRGLGLNTTPLISSHVFASKPPLGSKTALFSALRDVTAFASPHHFCAHSYSLSHLAFHKPCPRLQPPDLRCCSFARADPECIPSLLIICYNFTYKYCSSALRHLSSPKTAGISVSPSEPFHV